MTPAHVVFIPAVFAVGFFFGAMASQRKRARSASKGWSGEGKSLAFGFSLFLVVLVATHALDFPGGAKSLGASMHGSLLLDRHPSFSTAEVHDRLNAYGEVGRQLYQRFTFTADLIFPSSLLAFLLMLARFVNARSSLPASVRGLLLGVPVVWFVTDMFENLLIYRLLAQFPNESLELGRLLGTITMAKFGLLAASLLIPALVAGLCAKPATLSWTAHLRST